MYMQNFGLLKTYTHRSYHFHYFKGHDCSPVLFSFEDKILKVVWKLDVASPETNSSGVSNAFKMFRASDRTASTDTAPSVASLKTLHQNAIS